ncbi:hypothetical protein NOCA1140004 [metagenome]|uniref:Uncharacterized protein n=1 Tax=metagenome TaxID=256318 RepID=A0A2P2C8D1_9ZZZZ
MYGGHPSGWAVPDLTRHRMA